ncbi:MAG: hypothetical protein MR992_13545 [Lachnospiraceae bacterium]|nr:hypothetical protein [Lachnospiraceae bacterium]MDD7627982.1 hypothetical protein [Lachnospiraceae bacterium]MDY4119763.1 hypothetical protein [Lachnospiraceae bacterium]
MDSTETLINHGDEISLVMLINKLQSIEDVEQFRVLPTEKVDEILKDTPDYLLDIIANVLRAFLRKENVPEEETETLVGKVKEKKKWIYTGRTKCVILSIRYTMSQIKSWLMCTERFHEPQRLKTCSVEASTFL